MTNNPAKILLLLFLANLLNIIDRAILGIVAEPLRIEWNLSDFDLGRISAAFTIVYAILVLPFGWLIDLRPRKTILGFGLLAWSFFTAIGAASWNFSSFLLTRIGVAVGEATCVPAATSLIGDLYPANRRSRAIAVFALGVPVGFLLAFLFGGIVAQAFESWRAPFLLAIVPGIVVSAFIFGIREPERGAKEPREQHADQSSFRAIAGNSTLWWIMVSGIVWNVGAGAVASFIVPMLQRFDGLSLATAGAASAVIIGVMGIIGLVAGGEIADRLHERSSGGRFGLGIACHLLAAAAILLSFVVGANLLPFLVLFSFGWLLQYVYPVCALPAVHDVVAPRNRGLAIAICSATSSLLGGTSGPLLTGFLSDHYARQAMVRAGAVELNEQFKAFGLHEAMSLVVPVSLLATALTFFLAWRSMPRDIRTATVGADR